MAIKSHSRSFDTRGRIARKTAEFTCLSRVVRRGVAFGLAASLAAGGVGCGESDDGTESERDGLSPGSGGSNSVENSGQGGSITSEPTASAGSSSLGGSSGAMGSAGTEGSLTGEIPLGSAGGGGASSGPSGSGGAGMAGATAMGGGTATGGGGGMVTEPPAFAPCPTDGSPCRIMPLGDSITHGFIPNTANLSDGGYRVEFFRQAVLDGHDITLVGTRPPNGPNAVEGQPFPRNHEGISGDTIQGVAGRLNAAIAAGDPDIILLHIGTNNLTQAAAAAPALLENLLDQVTESAPDALIVVAQIIPLGFGNAVPTYNAAMSAMVQERVDAGKHLMILDMFTPFSDSGSLAQRLPDNIHPDVEGYAVMGRTWYEAIESVLP